MIHLPFLIKFFVIILLLILAIPLPFPTGLVATAKAYEIYQND